MSCYNLRNHNSSRESDERASPKQKSKQNPYSPNRSGDSSSYRDQSSLYNDDDFTESQDEDEVDSSYASTTYSPTATTPSPDQKLTKRGTRRLGSASPQIRRGMYPDLSDLAEETPSPRQERKATSPDRKHKSADPGNNAEVKFEHKLILLGVVVCGIIMILLLGSSEKKIERSSEFQNFASEVDKLQKHFKSQERRTWRSIKSSVKHILNGTDPEYPAVVMFAGRKQDKVGSCLARRVASLFNSITTNSREDGYLDARLLSHLETAIQKQELDEKIHSNFQMSRSVVIDHLEALAPTASLLLHGICDNDNAPFKNVFIGIVFYVDRVLGVRDVDAELMNYFAKELDMDKIGALLTRVNNNAVVIVNENELDSGICG